jgi:hypothetical protein
MKRPENIIETKEYVEPYSFEKDREAVLFYAYVELQKYVDSLELKLNNLLKPDVSGRSKQLKASLKQCLDKYGFTLPDRVINEFVKSL